MKQFLLNLVCWTCALSAVSAGVALWAILICWFTNFSLAPFWWWFGISLVTSIVTLYAALRMEDFGSYVFGEEDIYES